MAGKATPFLEALKNRRTYYGLEKSSTIPDSRVEEIIKETILHTPSSFNSQSTRIILLVKEEHDKLWDFTLEALKGVVPADQFEKTAQRISMFKNAYGTVMFFDDRRDVQKMQEAYAMYADKFPPWAQESTAMHQIAIWTALELEGLGVNLQHYHPLIDAKVESEWKVPQEWEMRAQMVFGKPTGPPGYPGMDKTFKPVEGERFVSYGV